MPVNVPIRLEGKGTVLAGLNWQVLGVMNEKAVVRGQDAQWYCNWEPLAGGNEYLACLPKGAFRNAQVAGAPVVQKVVSENTFLLILELKADKQGEKAAAEQRKDLFWVLGLRDCSPVLSGSTERSADFVGTLPEVLSLARDFMQLAKGEDALPVYTNCADAIIEPLKQTAALQKHVFDLEIFAGSVEKKHFAKAKFKRYHALPLLKIGIAVTVFMAAGAYGVHYMQDAAATAKRMAEQRKKADQERQQQLKAQLDLGINSLPSVEAATNNYLNALQSAPVTVGGWKLTEVNCAGSECMLTYKSEAFATWETYERFMPKSWLKPTFDNQIDRVLQPVFITALGEKPTRKTEDLLSLNEATFRVGNLAQLSRNVGISMKLESQGARVVQGVEEAWMPYKLEFQATGPAPLLASFVRRISYEVGVKSLSFKLEKDMTFDIKGEVYAKQ